MQVINIISTDCSYIIISEQTELQQVEISSFALLLVTTVKQGNYKIEHCWTFEFKS